MDGADLRGALFDKSSVLAAASLDGAFLGLIDFGATNWALADWGSVQVLGDEKQASKDDLDDDENDAEDLVSGERAAARTYRALASALRMQGIVPHHANRFEYRAEVLQRRILWRNVRERVADRNLRAAAGAYLRWCVSRAFDAVAGYGYRLGRVIVTYLVLVGAFSVAMLLATGQVTWAGVTAGHFPSLGLMCDVLVFSITSFHGRGVQPSGLIMNGALTTLAGVEAIIGLAIEVLLVATVTRRVLRG